jgi:hypothetical protein
MPQLFDQLRDFLSEVENEKRASVKKRAEANTETTAQGGPTSHPSKDKDDGTTPATDGTRSKENTGDVKKMIPTGGVDAASDDAASQEDQQYDVGISSTSTGEDPSNEDNYKSDKEDPGTSHPAKTTDGEKYSSLHFGQLRKLAAHKANDILSDIVKRAEEECEEDEYEDKEESKKKMTKDEEGESSDQEEVEEMAKEEAKEAGYIDSKGRLTSMGKVAAAAGEAAATLTEAQHHELVKHAQASVASSIEHTIADGLEKAAMVGAYLQSFYKAAAEGEAAGGEGGDQSPAEMPQEGSGMEMDPSMLSQMAGEESAPQGAPEEGQQQEGDAIQELLMALQEQGIEPEQLLQMIQSGELGGAGGAPPMDPAMAGGAPMMDPSMMGGAPEAAPKMASYRQNQETLGLVKLVKKASLVKNAQIRAGKFRVTEAKTAQQRVLRDQIKACVRDIIG